MSSFKKHSEDDLKIIVQNYQQGDSYAAEQLRQQFCPLIYKLSHRHSMNSAFGEDAENIVWLLFFEFIFDYKGEDFARLPGLIRRFLIFRLLRLLKKQGARWDNEKFLESETGASQVEECEPLQKLINKLALEQEILFLRDWELNVVKEIYYKNNTYSESARNLNCTPRKVRYYNESALKRLKKAFKI